MHLCSQAAGYRDRVCTMRPVGATSTQLPPTSTLFIACKKKAASRVSLYTWPGLFLLGCKSAKVCFYRVFLPRRCFAPGRVSLLRTPQSHSFHFSTTTPMNCFWIEQKLILVCTSVHSQLLLFFKIYFSLFLCVLR